MQHKAGSKSKTEIRIRSTSFSQYKPIGSYMKAYSEGLHFDIPTRRGFINMAMDVERKRRFGIWEKTLCGKFD